MKKEGVRRGKKKKNKKKRGKSGEKKFRGTSTKLGKRKVKKKGEKERERKRQGRESLAADNNCRRPPPPAVMEKRRGPCKRALVEFLDGNDDDADKVYKFQILLPNGSNTRLTLHDPGEEMPLDEFFHAIRTEVEKTAKLLQGPRRKIMWNNDVYLEDMHDYKIKKKISFNRFKTNKCHILKLHDGAGPSADTFHNMWDLTPDTDLLQELPAEYTFETALADLIDNSLQAVWSNAEGERRLVSVTVEEQKIIIFDSGPGMDGSDENSISKWGKMGSSNHRHSRQIAIGGKAPYLMPFFGMFGYGGPIASMHLGRHAIVSSKTKESKNVYTLHLSREALMKRSTEKSIWRADGGIRDPLDEEIQLSPHGSFMKVEICDLKMRCVETFKLQCMLKDVYFPYIQCDEQVSSKQTTMPVEFQVNHTDLAEIEGGEVAVTNLHSCNGPDFVFQLHLTVTEGDPISKSPGSRSCRQANARLKCVYFPIVEGKENINRILEKLEADGFPRKEDFERFSRLSIRRLGRLLPDARWRTLPFMEPQQKRGDKAQLLRRCCPRVKCFVDTDAGFSPTPSKTDLAHHDPFTLALRSFGSKPSGEESVGAAVDIHKDGKSLNLLHLEKEFYDWVVQMHDAYDEEAECGEDEPVVVIAPSNKKKLGITADAVRVYKVIKRKGLLWKSGQKVKILKGAVGCSKNNLYATLEYFLLEGFQGEACGEARIICRLLGCPVEKGCLLVVNDGSASLNIRDSQSFPISEIDNGKIQPIDDVTWSYQLEKKEEKAPSRIDILTGEDCSLLDIMGELPLSVEAGYDPPDKIVAVIRPASYTTSSGGKGLEQKYIIKDDMEMSMEVRLVRGGKDFQDGNLVFAQRVKPTQRNGFHGLYIFSLLHQRAKLFTKAGVYIFSFSVVCKDLTCKKRDLSVTVQPASSIRKWKFYDKGGPLSDNPVLIRVGSCVSYLSVECFDQFMNPIPFSKLPEVKIKASSKKFIIANVDKMTVALSSNHLFLEITDMLFESRKLDMIRPQYGAALGIYSLEDELLAEVPCRVMPGPVSSIMLQCCSENEKHLRPDTVIKEFVLEVWDAYGNHIEEGVELPVQVDGLCFQDHLGSIRKVNDQGYVNLSGLLKVTAGYGSRGRVFVSMGEKMMFEKKFQVAERKLRVVSWIPSNCLAGSQLKNIIFEVFDSDGFIDETINGQHHTLIITSESSTVDDTIQYTFKNGRCIVPALSVPRKRGPFRFLACHTQYPDLHINIEVQVVQVPKLEMVPITDADAIISQPQFSDDGLLPMRYSSQCSPRQLDVLRETIMDEIRNFDEETVKAGLQVKQHEDKLKILKNQKEKVAKEICFLQGRMVPKYLTHVESLANLKGQIMKSIEGKRNTAAAVFCNLSKAIQTAETQKHFMQDFVGLVALLGTVSDSKHSSVFAEYLGKDYMLAVVCKSFKAVRALEMYGENGKVTHNSALHAEAASMGITINRRFPVICLEEIRPYKGDLKKNDPQRKLALPNPLLPCQKIPSGFLGYAVNMIGLDIDHLNTRTAAGYGLRETLFYRLFGETQVYKTREHMLQATACIKHGALSLDGGIMKENGIIFLGDHEPAIRFPVVVPDVKGGLSQNSISILEQIEEKRALLEAIHMEIERETEAHLRAVAKFHKKKDKYNKYLEKNTLVMGNLFQQSPQWKTS